MPDPHLDSLLEQARWVRELARSLVRDPDVADDLAQDALVIALERADSPPRSMRGWLASIVRHRLWERMRAEDRRSAREEESAQKEAQESTAEVVARASAHRSVVETLMELPEPYRDVLLLRYFEGETPTAIARKTGVPIATVKTRLQRGLAAMRERLDRRNGGDGKAWLSALAPLLRTPNPVGTTLPFAAVVAGLLVAGGTLVILLGPHGLPGRDSPAPRPDRADVRPLGTASLNVEEARELGEREPVVSGRDAGSAAVPGSPRLPSIVRGTVSDPAGAPVAGVVVRFDPDAPRGGRPEPGGTVVAVSDSAGAFELRGVRGRGRVQALSEDRVTLYAGEAGGYDEWTPHVVVAPRTVLSGRVVDTEGVPLPGAHVRIDPSTNPGRSIEPEHSWRERFATWSDEVGEFVLAAPDVAGAKLVVALEGYAEHREALPPNARALVALESRATTWVQGQVFDADGLPVAGARVSNGREERQTDERGAYRIAAPAAGGAIVAALPGRLPARALEAPGGGWPDPLELRLGGPPLTIAGRVVDRAGNGLRGIRVAVEVPSLFLARSRTEAVTETWRDDPDPETDRGRPVLLENLIAGEATELSHEVETGTDGTFELAGLLDRPYRVAAVDPMSLARGRSDFLPAGTTGARIELASTVVPRIEGRVVDRAGRGVQGVTLLPFRTLQGVQAEGILVHHTDVGERAALSDADGSFFLSEVAADGVEVRIEGPDVFPTVAPLRLGKDGRFDVVVDRSASVRFVDGPWADAEVVLVDGAGSELPSIVTRGGRRTRGQRWLLKDGASPPLEVSTAAHELVVRAEGEEVLRVPLSLNAGERRIVRP